MPLFRIETRSSTTEAKPRARASGPTPGGPSMAPAMVVGAFVGVLLIAGFAAFSLGRGSRQPGAPPVAESPAVSAVTRTVTSTGSSLPSADESLPPINLDFPREAVVALVNGEPFTMGQLETAVRIGRTLGTLSGDDVPAYTSQDMLDFQIRMLKRQVDVLLMKQAFQAHGLEDPVGLPMEGLIDSFLDATGATDQDLEAAMVENGVTRDDLLAWFTDSQQANQFAQQILMEGRDASEREQVTNEWLTAQWDQGEIYVTFYDPDSDEWSPPVGADAATVPTEPAASGGSAPTASP